MIKCWINRTYSLRIIAQRISLKMMDDFDKFDYIESKDRMITIS